MSRNLTVHLDDGTIHKAKVLAARRTTSVSRLVAGEIERLVEEDDRYERAHQSALARLAQDFPLGDGSRPHRASLHDR